MPYHVSKCIRTWKMSRWTHPHQLKHSAPETWVWPVTAGQLERSLTSRWKYIDICQTLRYIQIDSRSLSQVTKGSFSSLSSIRALAVFFSPGWSSLNITKVPSSNDCSLWGGPPRSLGEAPWVRIPPRPLAWAGSWSILTAIHSSAWTWAWCWVAGKRKEINPGKLPSLPALVLVILGDALMGCLLLMALGWRAVAPRPANSQVCPSGFSHS